MNLGGPEGFDDSRLFDLHLKHGTLQLGQANFDRGDTSIDGSGKNQNATENRQGPASKERGRSSGSEAVRRSERLMTYFFRNRSARKNGRREKWKEGKVEGGKSGTRAGLATGF